MARIFKTPFGAQGDTEQVPEAPQGDGSVSLTQGFGYDYERGYEDPAAKDIRREVMNGLFHDVTEAIGDIQLSGVAKWSAAAAPYPAGAVVWHDSVAWMSTVGNNSVEPSEGASWSSLATANEVASGYVPQSRTISAGTGLSGGGNLSVNRTLSVNYGTAAGTAAQGNDSRIVNAVPNSRTISSGTGLRGGGNLNANRTLSVNFASVAQARALSNENTVLSPALLNAALKGSNQSLTVNGYQIFPGGLIIQWGTLVGNGHSVTWNFPITFPNGCLNVHATDRSSEAGGGVITLGHDIPTRTSVRIYAGVTGSVSMVSSAFAIGY